MKRSSLAIVLLWLVTSACRPEVGPPISQVGGPTILAVKGTPAEVDPRSTKTSVVFEALAVDESGRVPGPSTDIADPLQWAICDQPKPPTENNSVSANCLDPDLVPGIVGPTPTTFNATIASNACALFGPTTPPAAEGQAAIRPRDADVTGGYYQPVRVELFVPEGLRRPAMSTSESMISFELQRIQCGLANAPGDKIHDYTANYKLNTNPTLTQVTIQVAGATVANTPATATAGPAIAVPAGQSIDLAAYWSEDSVENYPAWDVLTRDLVYHNESMRVSWYATGGTFEHDITGRGENDQELFAPNTWKSDTASVGQVVHLWLVLHDSRGGTDFASLDFNVTP
jgi:hypothetical protein